MLPDTLTIKLMSEDIKKGTPGSPTNCAIALRIAKVIPEYSQIPLRVSVDIGNDGLVRLVPSWTFFAGGLYNPPQIHYYLLGKKGETFTRRFDKQFTSVQPQTFDFTKVNYMRTVDVDTILPIIKTIFVGWFGCTICKRLYMGPDRPATPGLHFHN